MENRYSRNRIYISQEEQVLIKDVPILLAGCGIGSEIAECALRFGFENLTIIDGDTVELTNLNRQNFTEKDIDSPKVEAIKKRLLGINDKANITIYNTFLTADNLEQYIPGHQIAINALDFSSDVPLRFDQLCSEHKIPVLHPYNMGWGGLLAVIDPAGARLDSIERSGHKFSEIDFVEYALGNLSFWGNPQDWVREVVEKFKNEDGDMSPPQLAIGSWIVAAMCTTVLFDLAVGATVKKFPEFYFNAMKGI
ncbi:thiamine biosynthesis protein ThiF [Sphingobacterium sp. ML3W]|uniref:HesA/MoeB/ThiF family protein n=1 Tax=Sphingobacterium sp. ML3W TaxID=1538644 RepID=UPI0004F5DB2D|nr:ThiF family adenylyltransferase [Sphingobacterium sp. ML3W]AIM39241.1 thiamine biosynthesis protein ThiF [Sphingobacterium sp. ML3W]